MAGVQRKSGRYLNLGLTHAYTDIELGLNIEVLVTARVTMPFFENKAL